MADRLYSPKDIMAILSVSKSEAVKIMHMFEASGKLYRIGSKMIRVKQRDFDAWLKTCEGRERA